MQADTVTFSGLLSKRSLYSSSSSEAVVGSSSIAEQGVGQGFQPGSWIERGTCSIHRRASTKFAHTYEVRLRSSFTPTKSPATRQARLRSHRGNNKRCAPDERERAPISWPVVVAAARHAAPASCRSARRNSHESDCSAVFFFAALQHSSSCISASRRKCWSAFEEATRFGRLG